MASRVEAASTLPGVSVALVTSSSWCRWSCESAPSASALSPFVCGKARTSHGPLAELLRTRGACSLGCPARVVFRRG